MMVTEAFPVFNKNGKMMGNLTSEQGIPPAEETSKVSSNDIDVDALYKEFNSSPKKSKSSTVQTNTNDNVDVDALYKEFGGATEETKPSATSTKSANNGTFGFLDNDLIPGIVQGVKDVPNSVGKGIAAIDRFSSKLTGDKSGEERANTFDKRLAAENEQFDKTTNGSTSGSVGRIAGQTLATAPLLPVRAAQGIKAGIEALPIVGNKLTGLIGSGGVAGGIFGAVTNASNDEGLASNVGTGIITGAIGAPVIAGAAAAGSKLGSAVANVWKNVNANKIAKEAGMEPSAVKNIIARFEEIGITPQEAQQRLNKLGPNGTLADLDSALTVEAGGLASMGGKPTSTLKNRFSDRAAGADTRANDLLDTKLGVKPDLDAEKELIVKQAQRSTDKDYKAAKASNQAFDLKPIADDIDSQLENAVGSKASALQKARDYLFDKNGNIKVDTKQLHEIRIGLDSDIKKLASNPETSQDKVTLNAVDNVRKEIDKLLKTNPEMAAADQKFAQAMDVKSGLDIGQKAIGTKPNFDQFEKVFNASSPEKKEAIKKGLRAALGDVMERASRGELDGIQRTLGKNAGNRKILREAFGQDADEVLDALHAEAVMRRTEQRVGQNSATAERQAVQSRPEYGGSQRESGLATNIAQGAALDIATGTPGGATAIGAGRSAIQGIKNKLTAGNIKKTVEGSADLLSRSGSEANNVLTTVSKVQNRLTGSINNSRLPVRIYIPTTAAAPVGDETVKRGNRLRNSF